MFVEACRDIVSEFGDRALTVKVMLEHAGFSWLESGEHEIVAEYCFRVVGELVGCPSMSV